MSSIKINPKAYQSLGTSGLKISKIIVGCMSYGNKNWAPWVIDNEEEAFKILKACYDNNLRTYDTADMYSNGVSEIILGKFLKHYNIRRDSVVILSKLYFPVNPDTNGPNVSGTPEELPFNTYGLSRKHVFDAAKASYERLGTYIDVLQIHRLDKSVPPKEIMRALNDVINAGYARYIGASSMKAYEFATLQHIAEKYDYHQFVSMQNYYNLLYREEEREMIPYCNETGVGLIPWSPNARGVLTRPRNKELTERAKSDPGIKRVGLDQLTEADIKIIDKVEEIAEKRGVSMAVISTAWVLSKGAAAIVGISSETRIQDYLKAIDFELSEEEIKELEEPYRAKFFIS